MSESEPPADDALEPPGKSGPSVVVLLMLAAVGAGAGGYFGGPIATPMIAEVIEGGGEGGGGGHGDDGYGGGEEDEEPFAIENLVLNPAGSGASRFLIATLVLDATPEAESELSSREAEARDLLLTILSTMTVEQLTDIQRRDVIREDLRAALNTMLGYEGVYRIFFPQFVIQ